MAEGMISRMESIEEAIERKRKGGPITITEFLGNVSMTVDLAPRPMYRDDRERWRRFRTGRFPLGYDENCWEREGHILIRYLARSVPELTSITIGVGTVTATVLPPRYGSVSELAARVMGAAFGAFLEIVGP